MIRLMKKNKFLEEKIEDKTIKLNALYRIIEEKDNSKTVVFLPNTLNSDIVFNHSITKCKLPKRTEREYIYFLNNKLHILNKDKFAKLCEKHCSVSPVEYVKNEADYSKGNIECKNGVVTYSYQAVSNYYGDGWSGGEIKSSVTDKTKKVSEFMYAYKDEDNIEAELFDCLDEYKGELRPLIVEFRFFEDRYLNNKINWNKKYYAKEYFNRLKHICNMLNVVQFGRYKDIEDFFENRVLIKTWGEIEKEIVRPYNKKLKKLMSRYKFLQFEDVRGENYYILVKKDIKQVVAKCNRSYIGRIIGKGGENVKRISKQYNIYLKLKGE